MKCKRKNEKFKTVLKNTLCGVLIARVAFSAIGTLLFFNVGATDAAPLTECEHSLTHWENYDNYQHQLVCDTCGYRFPQQAHDFNIGVLGIFDHIPRQAE